MAKAFARFTVKSANADTGEIVGIASTPQTDRVGDVLEPHGAMFSLPLPLLFAHDHGQPVGAVTEAKVTPDGIRVVAKLALDASERVRECWELIKAGALRGLSVGFLPLAHEPISGGGYRFTSWDWHELSIVAVPCNQSATIANIKSYSAMPVSALRIHPVSEPRKEAKTVTIQERTAMADQVVAGASVQWLTRAKAIAAIENGPLEHGLDACGAPAEIVRRLKAVAESTTTQPGLAGGSAEVQAFISQAAETSVLLRLISDRAGYQVPLRTAVYLPDSDMTASLIGEGQPIPIQGFDLDRTSVDTFKIGGAFAATEDVIRNTSPAGQAFLNHQLRGAVAKASDVVLFARLTDSGTLSLGGGATWAEILVAVREALGAVITRATDRAYFAFSVQAANYLSALEDAPDDTNPWDGTFLGRPAIITEGLAGMNFAVVNAHAVVGAVDSLDIGASNAGTVELVDNPTNDSITGTATTQVSLWQTNSIAVKVVTHLACEPIRANGVAFIEIEPGSGA